MRNPFSKQSIAIRLHRLLTQQSKTISSIHCVLNNIISTLCLVILWLLTHWKLFYMKKEKMANIVFKLQNCTIALLFPLQFLISVASNFLLNCTRSMNNRLAQINMEKCVAKLEILVSSIHTKAVECGFLTNKKRTLTTESVVNQA